MVITYTFAGLPVTDYEAAYEWYVRLFGRAADMFPRPTEAVWRLTASSAVYVVQDTVRAGNGLLTVALDDLDALEALAAVDEAQAPRRLVVTDPDGNTLTFFEDPGESSP